MQIRINDIIIILTKIYKTTFCTYNLLLKYCLCPYEDMAQFTTTCPIDLFCASSSWLGLHPPSFTTTTATFSKSLSTSFNQVSFCPPFGFFTSCLASFNALFAGVLSGSLSKCPYHLNLRSFTILLHSFTPHFSYRSSFLILSGHLIFMIFLKVFLWKISTVFSRLLSKSTVHCCREICSVYDYWRVWS